ncbi:PCMD domain-containing protein [Parabacteroides gordonii]|uniref:PCMD domain-containing protein n=1 Tax=Parabacteroides gordonii TaxID=574930 RepID=UPI00241EE62D|nr:PCMD domain-containing protein [Parabacteroides gordonii]
MLLLLGCVKNDFPYPTIKCAITDFGVDGMTSVKIDASARTVVAKVVDTLDLRDLRVNRLEVTEKTTVIPDDKACIDFTHFPDTGFVSVDSLPATANTRMSFKEPVNVLLRLYQDYPWTITVLHDIERMVKVNNMVSPALIDEVNHNVVILVDSAKQPKLTNIEIEELKLGSSVAKTEPEPSSVTDFTRPRVFRITAFGEMEEWTVSVRYPSGDEGQTSTLSAWTKRAYMEGTTKTGDVSARYRELSETETKADDESVWESVLSNEIEIFEDGRFVLTFTHLKPGATYEYELTVDGKTDNVQTFTTEPEEKVPNLSFDDWFKDGKSWYANKDLTADNYFWDSGNKGSNTVGEANPTSPETSDVVKGKAARLESKTVAGVFAAGSLYTGTFGKVEGLSGASLNFGRPYSSRPSALKGYYKYNAGTIDKAKTPYEDLIGQKDSCHIYVGLFTWDKPFPVNTSTGTFVDRTWNNENMVAYGELVNGETIKDYTPFTIRLKYRDYTTKPTYILIVASASKYGDYFTGSTSSVLLLDECELVFE